jgi:hypothetical protein
MDREDLTRMAREAGGYKSAKYPDEWRMDEEDLERFAALVAGHEREACAKLCDEIYFQNYPDAEEWERSEEGEAIRKRSHV